MEVGKKLELSITADEVEVLSKAIKNEKFQEMLSNYFQEISSPENVKTYQEEVTLLEQKRGNSIEFINPTPFRALETSVDGKQRCFINICACDKVGKPESKTVRTVQRFGERWSLPHLLQPGRQNCERKGNISTIYDVCFHPETLHLADKSEKFMDMVKEVAIQGIQKAFKVLLDKSNLKEMDIKYKGVPQSCVIRKPIPGYEAKEPPEERDLSPSTSHIPENSIDVPSKLLQKQPEEPMKPIYAVKYRSVIDLQDFRVSRESARSLRPTEIVITIDLPLLPTVNGIVLEVEEKRLLLESENPSYRLELNLSYPVDENNGKAKFNKHQRQLTVTLPVQPPPEAPQLPGGSRNPTSDPQNENQTRVEELEEGRGRVEEMEEKGGGGEQRQRGNDNGAAPGRRQVMEDLNAEKEGKRNQKRNERPEHEVKNETLRKKHDEKFGLQDVQQEKKGNCSNTKEDKCCRRTKDSLDSLILTTAASPDGQKKHILTQETEKPKNAQGSVEIPTSSQESLKVPVTSATTAANVNTSDETSKRKPTEKQLEDTDEDVLPAEQSFQEPEEVNVPAAGTLRQIDAAGNEKMADPHTSAGFVLQNKLMYELD
uniref:Protein kintoun n=1 Tax=Oryzias sinensis TaxID=183150 RepID=A0A8C7ZB47_9TELE